MEGGKELSMTDSGRPGSRLVGYFWLDNGMNNTVTRTERKHELDHQAGDRLDIGTQMLRKKKWI